MTPRVIALIRTIGVWPMASRMVRRSFTIVWVLGATHLYRS